MSDHVSSTEVSNTSQKKKGKWQIAIFPLGLIFSTHIIPGHTSKPDHSYSVETRPKGKLPRVNAQSGVILEEPSNYQTQFSVIQTFWTALIAVLFAQVIQLHSIMPCRIQKLPHQKATDLKAGSAGHKPRLNRTLHRALHSSFGLRGRECNAWWPAWGWIVIASTIGDR